MAQLEIACFNIASALIAKRNGADRIEFCDGILVGGITPSLSETETILSSLEIDLYVMIRPRGGNFVYSQSEFEEMKTSIIHFKKCKVNGFVFGILNENNTINKEQNKELLALSNPLPCTFHRAFDEVTNPFQSLEELIECGFQSVLTSGQAKNVVEGAQQIAQLVENAKNRITIIPGGGLRSNNIESIKQITKATFYHSSAITNEGEIPNPSEIKALKSKLK